MKLCKQCNTEIPKQKQRNDYCNRSCAATATNKMSIWTQERKDKIRNTLSKKYASGNLVVPIQGKPKLTLVCLTCKSEFIVYSFQSNRKYCSVVCRQKNSSSDLKGKAGGYRNGSGRAKSGYYNGIYCGSTYELAWVIYALDHNIEFSRFIGKLQNDTLTYVPDFLLADGRTIIELKGYEHSNTVDAKTQLAESLGYTVKVLRKKDLTEVFDYVKLKYGTADFKTLYQ
jgi:hypothetical protein